MLSADRIILIIMKTVPRYAIESINYNQLINESRLSPHYEKIAPADSFHAANRGEAAAVDILTIYTGHSVPPAESGHRLHHRPPVQQHLAPRRLHLRQLRDPAPHHQVIMVVVVVMMMMMMMIMMITGGT